MAVMKFPPWKNPLSDSWKFTNPDHSIEAHLLRFGFLEGGAP
jgi:hypothetical protein